MSNLPDAPLPLLFQDGTAEELSARADASDRHGPWASGVIDILAQRGILAAFVPADSGGTGAGEPATLDMLVALASTCLTTALAVSQWAAAIKIMATAPPDLRASILPPLARGREFTTVGISQITTSRQHLGNPVLMATRDDKGWRLDGLCPWVTGADSSDTIVTGAATPDGNSLFFIVATEAEGVVVDPPLDMLALSGSRTSAVHFNGARPAHVIAPPGGTPARTGGLATTALALGATLSAVAIVAREATRRPDLDPVARGLETEVAAVRDRMRRAAHEGITIADRDLLRGDATSLVLRAAQAAVTASKGAGFVRGHPAERIARESFFFLVWSCPHSVSSALLCEWAGISADAGSP